MSTRKCISGTIRYQGIIVHSLVLICASVTYVYINIRVYIKFVCFTGLERAFAILDENTSTQGVAYDYRSLMHLGPYAFAKGTDETIVPLKVTDRYSNRISPTFLDILHIKILYCQGNTQLTRHPLYTSL